MMTHISNFSSVFWEDLLAVRRHVSEDTEQELALLPGVKGRGDDDITALLQLLSQKDAAGVDVYGACYFLLGSMHTVLPVQLHLQGSKIFSLTAKHISACPSV